MSAPAGRTKNLKEANKRKRYAKRTLVISLSLLVGMILIYVILAPESIKVEVAQVTRGPFEEVLEIDGEIITKDRRTVTAFADGDILEIDLEVGDQVVEGEVLTQLLWDVRYRPIKAPLSGVISKVHRKSAGPVARGTPLLEIIDPHRLEVVAEVLTTDAVKLSPGNPVRVQGWGGDGDLEARITQISKAGFKKISALGVEEERTLVKADFLQLPEKILRQLGDHYHVDLTLSVQKLQDVLKVPIGSVFRDGQNWAVYGVHQGQAKKKSIVISHRNLQEAVITQGLAEGESVIVYPGDRIQEGTPVEAL